MAITVNHTFVSEKEDGADETVVRPGNWNDAHKLRVSLNKLILGAGPDAPPTEVDLPGGVSHSEPARALDTVYQNTSGKTRFVTVNVDGKAEDTIGKTQSLAEVNIGSSSPPGTLVARIGIDGMTVTGGTLEISMRSACSFIVPPSWYYEVEKYVEGVSLSLVDWHEWDLF